MPVTGLYFIPTTSAETSPLSDILARLTTTYNLTPVAQRWNLEHRLFRETPNPDRPANAASSSFAVEEKLKAPGPRYLQLVFLSYLPGRSYVAITSTPTPSQTRAGTPSSSNISTESSGEPATVVSIPSGAQSEDFIQLLVSKFGPLWTQRPSLGVGYGLAYEVGDYGVRVGELRQGVGSAQLVRGVVVQVEWKEGNEGDWGEAEGLIRGFWETLGVKGAREILQVPGMDKGDENVRQWCEVLRLRG